MTVEAIAIDKNGEPIVLLNDREQERALPIWVGLLEARAISLTSQRVKTKRPLTHQLLLNTIRRLGYSVKEILLDPAEGDDYAASIVLAPMADYIEDSTAQGNDAGAFRSIEARPSDAIAIAIMSGVPVLVDAEIVAQSSLAVHKEERAERLAFKEFVQNVKASDFKSSNFKLSDPIELPGDNNLDLPEAG